MADPTLETITREEFDKRLGKNNERLQHELVEARERVQRLEALVARKEDFAQRLGQVLAEIEREESEIASLEKGLRTTRSTARQRPGISQAPR
jgi:hypothetical protein